MLVRRTHYTHRYIRHRLRPSRGPTRETQHGGIRGQKTMGSVMKSRGILQILLSLRFEALRLVAPCIQTFRHSATPRVLTMIIGFSRLDDLTLIFEFLSTYDGSIVSILKPVNRV